MIHFRLLIVAFAAYIISLPAYGDVPKKLALYFSPLEPLVSIDGKSGQLVDALKEISKRSGIAIETHVMPYARSFRKIENNEPVASTPYLVDAMAPERRALVQTSLPIAFRISLIWAREGIPFPETINDIKQYKLASADIARLPPPLYSDNNLRLIRTYDIQSAIHILKKGRADIFINDYATTMAAIKSEEANGVSFDPHGLRFVEPAVIVYAHSVEKQLIKKIDDAIVSMATDGTFITLMPHSFVDDYKPFLRQ